MRALLTSMIVVAPFFIQSPAQARTVEVEATLSGLWNGSMRLGGSPGTSVGIALGNYSVVSLGLGLHLYSSEDERENTIDMIGVNIPLELKLYLRRPAAQRILPVLRFGVAYGYGFFDQAFDDGSASVDNTWSDHGITGIAAAGIQYMFLPVFGVSTQMVLQAGRSLSSHTQSEMDQTSDWLALGWSAGLVFRL